MRDALGIEAQSIWSDDGIALHLPDADAPPTEELILDPDEVEDLVVAEVGQTALFGARFRENAGAGAADPASPPRRAHAALAAASEGAVAAPGRAALRLVPGHPRDVPRVPPGRLRPARAEAAPRGPRTRQIDVVDVETASASPYSASLLFDYVATYMYEDDTPPAERRAQALSLDRDLLRELLGQEELRDLIDPGALEEVERLAARAPAYTRPAPRPATETGRPADGEFDDESRRDSARERRAVLIRIVASSG